MKSEQADLPNPCLEEEEEEITDAFVESLYPNLAKGVPWRQCL
jgi:hypothetical protein